MSQSKNRTTTNHLFLLCMDFIAVLKAPLLSKKFLVLGTILVLHRVVALGEVLADFQLHISLFEKKPSVFFFFFFSWFVVVKQEILVPY